jgi:hypothetical protein
VTQGVSGAVKDKGSMRQYFPYLMQSLKHAMQDLGVPNRAFLSSPSRPATALLIGLPIQPCYYHSGEFCG